MNRETLKTIETARPPTRAFRRPGVTSLTFLLLLLCPKLSDAAENSPAPPDTYETPGQVNAEDFLPKSAFTGKIFAEKVAENNGLQNLYRIKAGMEDYEVTGSEAALALLQELRAIEQLAQISTGKAVESGLKQSAKETYETGKEIVRNPIAAARKVPEGASRFFGKVKGFFNRDEDDSDQKLSAGQAVKSVLGVDDAKRKLAARLGVDVYSRNQALQQELDRVASATAAGGVAFNIGTLPIGGAAGVGLTVIGIQQTVDSLINNSSQEDLLKWNEQKLTQLGVNPDLMTEFLNHPWYTLRQQTIITAALTRTKVDPTIFLQAANKALTEADARYYETVAELLAAYTHQGASLVSLQLEDGLVCALGDEGVLVVPVSLDYAAWTQSVAQRVNELAGLAGENQQFKRIEIWTDGKASERVKDELNRRAITYRHVSLITDD